MAIVTKSLSVAGGDVALQLIGNLQIEIADMLEGMIKVLFERSLERGVLGVANGEEHLVGAKIGVDTGKSGAVRGI